MLATSPKYLGLPIILFTLLLLFYFRGDVSQLPLRDTVSRHAKSWSQTVLHPNATSFEHDGTFDELSEGAPRVACVSMQFGGNFNLMTERGLRTHIGNGEKWGYPTHYLRQDIVGRGELEKGVYDKLLYLLTVMVNEMTKPFGKRAEWIVYVHYRRCDGRSLTERCTAGSTPTASSLTTISPGHFSSHRATNFERLIYSSPKTGQVSMLVFS